MVALKKYTRIEASGLWRASPQEQLREVIVSLGDATLTIRTPSDQALGHWSLAAIARANPGQTPARFYPIGDPGEELELAADEAEMVEAIEILRRAVDHVRPRPGRLRFAGIVLSFMILTAGLVFWVPGAVRDHTLNAIPKFGQRQLALALIAQMEPLIGPACGTSQTHSALNRLGVALDWPHLAVMRGGLDHIITLPADTVLIPRAYVENYDSPDVLAGHLLSAQLRVQEGDPLIDLLKQSGVIANFRLLTTGSLPAKAQRAYSEYVVRTVPVAASPEELANMFQKTGLSPIPYATAQGMSDLGNVIVTPRAQPLIEDADWLRIQAICQ
jgi:hypothetical protein